jgi:hypothetical protein
LQGRPLVAVCPAIEKIASFFYSLELNHGMLLTNLGIKNIINGLKQ